MLNYKYKLKDLKKELIYQLKKDIDNVKFISRNINLQ